MSCGSATCSSTKSSSTKSINDAREGSAVSLLSWMSRAVAAFGFFLTKFRARRFLLELEKARQRGILKELDDRLLDDIGVTHDEAMREARKRFWK